MTFFFSEQVCHLFSSDTKAWPGSDDSIAQGRLQCAPETSVFYQLCAIYITRADAYGTSPVGKLEKFTWKKSNSPDIPNTWFSLKQGSNSAKQLKNFVEDCAVFSIEM